MSEATLQALRDAGAPVDRLSPAERAVFASLNPEEVAIVSSIQARLNAADDEVSGQVQDNNVNVLC